MKAVAPLMSRWSGQRKEGKMEFEDAYDATPTPSRLDKGPGPRRADRPAKADMPRLLRISEVERECADTSPSRCTLGWIRSFLARPHSDLGRRGSVCPFVPTALGTDTIWMADVAEKTLTFERISALITEYRDVFLETEPTTGAAAINKAFIITFPSLADSGATGAAVIDRVQVSLKRYFVEMGLMLGEFHAANESPGLYNPDFRPLRSPIPMLAIRHMMESDLPFLLRDSYPPVVRSSYLRSYLFRLGGSLSQVRFNQAVDGLIAAELATFPGAA
jgi:hypothetical protein